MGEPDFMKRMWCLFFSAAGARSGLVFAPRHNGTCGVSPQAQTVECGGWFSIASCIDGCVWHPCPAHTAVTDYEAEDVADIDLRRTLSMPPMMVGTVYLKKTNVRHRSDYLRYELPCILALVSHWAWATLIEKIGNSPGWAGCAGRAFGSLK